MSFMQLELTRKGRLYCADCAKCGATLFAHEWAHAYNNDDRDALQSGTYHCDQCSGRADPETFTDCGMQYAARYSAPGYLDCTDWSYGTDKRKLLREVREMYGD
jgi:hypothetical protein